MTDATLLGMLATAALVGERGPMRARRAARVELAVLVAEAMR